MASFARHSSPGATPSGGILRLGKTRPSLARIGVARQRLIILQHDPYGRVLLTAKDIEEIEAGSKITIQGVLMSAKHMAQYDPSV